MVPPTRPSFDVAPSGSEFEDAASFGRVSCNSAASTTESDIVQGSHLAAATLLPMEAASSSTGLKFGDVGSKSTQEGPASPRGHLCVGVFSSPARALLQRSFGTDMTSSIINQELRDLEVERERLQVEKGELNDFRKQFLLSQIHSADEDIMKREQAVREEKRMVAEERSELAEQRLLLEDAKRELKEREETLVQQMIQSGMLAQDRLLATPAAHLAINRSSDHQMRRRLGRWCIGLLVVAFAVSSMRVWGATPLLPVACRGAWDRLRCLRAPTLTAWEPFKFANPLQIQIGK